MAKYMYLVDHSMSFNDLKLLKIGDVFYEQDLGMICKSIVTSNPEVISGYENRDEVSFNATVYDFDDKTAQFESIPRETNYMATDGLMHYGGKFYKTFSKWNYETQTTENID